MRPTVILFLVSFLFLYAKSQQFKKEILIEKKYLNIPIETKQKRQWVSFHLSGGDSTKAMIRVVDQQVDY